MESGARTPRLNPPGGTAEITASAHAFRSHRREHSTVNVALGGVRERTARESAPLREASIATAHTDGD